MRPTVLAVLLLPSLALAQPALTAAPGSPSADSVSVAFLDVGRAADSLAAVHAERVRSQQQAEIARLHASVPHTETLGTTGASVTLPGHWSGAITIEEGGLPGYALYTLRDESAKSPLVGSVLRIERVVGLDAVRRQRWTQGQTTYGYHGLTPVGPAAVSEGLGLEVAGSSTGGAVAFIRHGPALWSVAVEAPAETWAARRADLIGILAGVRLP